MHLPADITRYIWYYKALAYIVMTCSSVSLTLDVISKLSKSTLRTFKALTTSVLLQSLIKTRC